MFTTVTTIATADAAPAPAPAPLGSGSLAEWGLMGTLVVLTFQKGWQLFNQKEESESALVKQLIDGLQTNQTQKDSTETDLVGKLIEGLRENQSQMLGQMVRMTERSHDDIKDLKDAILSMTSVTQQELAATRNELARGLHVNRGEIANLRVLVNQMRQEVQASQYSALKTANAKKLE